MVFSRSLITDAMALYVLGNFEWYCMEVAFPPRPLPFDYEEVCPDFVLAEVEEYVRDYEVPELSQVVYLAMLLNDAVKLGRNRDRILEARWQEASSNSKEEESLGLVIEASLCDILRLGHLVRDLNRRPYGASAGWGAFVMVISIPDTRKRVVLWHTHLPLSRQGIEGRLRRAQIRCLVNSIANLAPAGGPEEDSRLGDGPPPSSDEE
ncbi:hypothetical protein Cgig2_023270 [Carnegiea gigantea]|uniref:Uncharacterized protein n=1 Tax=Carnegiea gigantea TaxID=171969 RepID=A0A9Q1GW68_9CARY|nr:hypothetical protein Cgig2_023270 [Carnegiea gigantea]